MKITIENGTAKVYTPYNREFVEKIKTIGGRKWDATEKCWTVPESEVETVRKHMMDVFGETDQPIAGEKVTVKITFNREGASDYREGIYLFGKPIIRAFGRDSGARVCDDVTLIEGKVTSGGSSKNWYTLAAEGTVLKVRNVPKAALEMIEGYDVTVEEIEETGINRQALEDEKAKLLARLAEIETLLAQ